MPLNFCDFDNHVELLSLPCVLHFTRFGLLRGLFGACGLMSLFQRRASFAYVLQADAVAKDKKQAVERLAACGRDWIVLDSVFDAQTLWEQADLDVLRRGHAGRKILAYISIAEAEEYRSYWRKEWGGKGRLGPQAPSWLGRENPDWAGNYRVEYWNRAWQELVLAMVDNVMACGVDGVYLDIVDGFETFEQAGGKYIDDRLNPSTKQSYRRDMVDWVKAVAARARAKTPAALVVPQNGSQLLAHADFLAVISAIGIEDLFTNGDKVQPKSHTRAVFGHLKAMAGTQKPILLIEYPKNAARQAMVKKLAEGNGLVWLLTDRALTGLGASGQ